MSPKKKIIYIISFIDKALIYEWTVQYFQNSPQFDVSYILLNPAETALGDFISKKNITLYDIKYTGKKDFLKALFKIYLILKKNKPDIINTNLFDASFVGQIAGKLAGVPVRILSRHYSSLHHTYFPHAVKYDRWMNKWATKIVVATNMVRDILINRENVEPSKVKVVNYGFYLERFMGVEQSRVESLRQKYFLQRRSKTPFPVIGVISRFIHWKGIQYIIPAFKKLLQEYPDAHLVLANASGDYKDEIRKMENELPVGSFTEIKFEQDSPALYKMFDVFVHVPVDYHSEAFGQIYIEALAAGVPSVFTISGIANDFIENKKNAMVVNYKNANEIYIAIKTIIENESLRNLVIENGKNEVLKKFKFERMGDALTRLYLEN